MNIHHVLFFCFISALCGDTGLVSARLHIFTGAEGGRGSISCYLSRPKTTKYFCKEECEAENTLVKTVDIRAQNGRFSTEYRGESSGRGVLTVTITNLTKSDAGRYRCGLGTDLVQDSYWDFEIRVSDELPFRNTGFARTDTEGENITFGCSGTVYKKQKFLCKDECKTKEDIIIETNGNRTQRGRYSVEYREGSTFGLYVTITNVSKSDTGWYKCGYGRALSPDSSNRAPVLVVGASDPSASWTTQSFTPPSVSPVTSNQGTVLLAPRVVCVVVIIALSAAVLLLVNKLKTNRTSDNMNLECFSHENRPPGVTGEECIYENVDPDSKDQHKNYYTRRS
ncbi:polymeric immunoglobulin receptor-like [Acanthopagrus latus]|uniref:polymeric immunoglobulin receptor-like n=1 Tax=Acanthopagrus latus TaxID=8177 RepID=UPI00187C72F6|nr:polymeric immunoglobulin receptor-like [Acanthopagrus latus]